MGRLGGETRWGASVGGSVRRLGEQMSRGDEQIDELGKRDGQLRGHTSWEDDTNIREEHTSWADEMSRQDEQRR